MNGTIVRGAIFCALVSGTLPCGAETWKDVEVMPKSAKVQLRKSPGDRTGGASVFQIEWPAKVKKVDGQWLKIADPGSYSREPIEGWVRKEEDVIKLDDAHERCSDKIREYEAKAANNGKGKTRCKGNAADNPWDLYWLRGIYWESKDEIESAIADFQRARQYNCQVGDVHHRLGRMWAKRATQFNANDVASFNCAFARFCKANEIFQSCGTRLVPPQLYDSWGDALADRNEASGTCIFALAAKWAYSKARQANPSWSVPPYKQGKLLIAVMDKGKTPEVAETTADRRILLAAIQWFDQAIRLDPSFGDAYRDRADALRRLASAQRAMALGPAPPPCDEAKPDRPPVRPDPPVKNQKPDNAALAVLDESRRSADRAFSDLGYNREPKSIEVKAKIEKAAADELYPDLKVAPVKPREIALARQAYSLVVRAEALATDAGSFSDRLQDVAERLQLAYDCEVEACLLRDHVANTQPCSQIAVEARARAAKELQQKKEWYGGWKKVLPEGSPAKEHLERAITKIQAAQDAQRMQPAKPQSAGPAPPIYVPKYLSATKSRY